MNVRVPSVRNIRTIKVYRGDPLIIQLGKAYTGGRLTAWMKRSPNAETFRSFEISESNDKITLDASKTSDYVDVSGNIIESVEGKWYFDVEFEKMVEGTESDPQYHEAETVVSGTILFVGDITNSSGHELDNPITGTVADSLNVRVTQETNIDLLTTSGSFYFDSYNQNEASSYTFSKSTGTQSNLESLNVNILGSSINIHQKHIDVDSEGTMITQTLYDNANNKIFSRTYNGASGNWTDWATLTNRAQIEIEDVNGLQDELDTFVTQSDLSSLGGGGGIIPMASAGSTTNSGYLYHAGRAYGISPSPEVHSRDAWLAGSIAPSANRFYIRFGAEFSLKNIYIINYYNNNNGIMVPVSGTGNAGVRECIIYSLNDDITPSTQFGANLGDMTEIFNGSLDAIDTEIFVQKIELLEAISSYGYVIDVISNHGGSNIGLRKTFATQ